MLHYFRISRSVIIIFGVNMEETEYQCKQKHKFSRNLKICVNNFLKKEVKNIIPSFMVVVGLLHIIVISEPIRCCCINNLVVQFASRNQNVYVSSQKKFYKKVYTKLIRDSIY